MLRFFFAMLAMLAACSGSGGDVPALGTAALNGTVIELDGQTADRSGVSVKLVETGAQAVTGADGSFRFERLPAGIVTLDFGGGSSLAQTTDDSGNEVREVEVEDGDEVEVRCSIDNGKIVEFSMQGGARSEAELKLESGGIELKVEVRSDDTGDRLEVELEGLAPGDAVEIFFDDVSFATLTADAMGEAKLELESADFAGSKVEVRDADTGEVLFSAEVPELPTAGPGTGEGEGDRARGKARLTPHVPLVEGSVEIRSRPDEQRFKMEAEHLEPGTAVAFLIEDGGDFTRIGTATADAEGKAEINTQDGLPMPLGASDVADLVGLEVRVIRDDESEELLLSGFVPALVAD